MSAIFMGLNTFVGENKSAVFAADVNLQSIVVAIEVRRRDLDPRAVYLSQSTFIFQPFSLVIEELFDLDDAHEKSLFRFEAAL
jgi:hypothetical protein